MATKKENLDYIVNVLTDIADDLYINFNNQKICDIDQFIYDINKDLYKLIDYIERRCY